ncbi:MAG TPA: hypothetical protein DDY78_12605 [Planctomycetales bacterium]|nr:hypothetical protein [Planctomycetales bacterium]
MQVSQIEAGQPLNLAGQQAGLQPNGISTAAWNVIFGNLMATVGTTTDSYNAALAQAATYLSSIGESTSEVSDVSRLYSFLVSQANASFPISTLTSAVDTSLSTPGSLSLALDRTFVSTIAGRYQQGIFGLGWTTSWQKSLSIDGSGNATINSGGALDFFVHEANGSYLDAAGEYGALTSSGGVFTFTDTAGTQNVFLADGLLNYVQDANGNRITLGYNGQNQLVILTYSNPSDASEPTEQLTLTYNAMALVSQASDGVGGAWNYVYDAAGHLLSVTAPGNLMTSYSYDTGSNPETANALLSITNPNGSQRNFTYDGQGRLSGVSQNGGADPITYAYPGEAEVTATDAAGDMTTVWYNDLGRASRVTDPRGGVTNDLYDANGNLVGATDAAGDTYQYSYNGNGNLTQIVNPLGQTVSLTYGSLSRLTSITDGAGNKTQYSYNSAGNLLSIAYPGGSQQSFSYDPLGNLSETVEQNGHPVGYEYNAQGLVTQESFADGSSETFAYDAHGNLLTAKTFNAGGTLTGTTTLTYNAANDLLSITYPNGQFLNFTYNAQGQRTQSVDQSGFAVNYSYDALGRLSALKDGANNLIVQYTYNNLGQLVKKVNGNGTYTTYAYDAAGDLTNEVNFAGGTTVNSSFTYTYNLLGEQTSVTDNTGAVTLYGYDATGQLTLVTLPGGQTIAYVYNAAGDRTEVVNNGTPTNYASNADNEITQVGATTYTYDANGNLHTMIDASGTTTYTYNDLNQLTSIAGSDGTTTAFQYSPLGFLVGTSVTSGGNTSQTNYLVDPTGLGNVAASYNGSGALIAHYTYGLGLVSQTGPSGTGYYDFNASGNTVGITGAGGAYVNQYSYQPFGETTTISAALPNPFTLAGQDGVMQIDANLFHMRARDYTPATGQFLSNDPIGLAGGDSNLRRYVSNDPVNLIDPTGLVATRLRLARYARGRPLDPTGPVVTVQTVLPNIAEVDDFGTERVIKGKARNRPNIFDVFDIFDERVTVTPRPGKKPLITVTPHLGTKYTENETSHDPNALIGPAGFGTQNFIQPIGALPYTIDFENDGTAAAQDVTVTEQLSSNLDWSTFQLGSFGFGPDKVNVPAGLTEYQTAVAYQNTDGSSLNVQVTLGFNVQTGLLTATFVSLDPLTGETPAGVFDGFLPPDDKNGIGEGFVQYTVQPKAGLTNSPQISAQASVIFDTNAAISTNTVKNLIETPRPTAVLGSNGSLSLLSPTGASQLLSPAGTILSTSAVTDGSGHTDVYAITSDHHLWEHSPGLPGDGWAILSVGSFQQISAATNSAGNAVVFAMLTDHSLWENSSLNAGDPWRELSPGGTILSISAVTDSSGNDDVFAVTSDTHLWEHTPTGWAILSIGSFQQISAGLNSAGQAVLYAVLTDNSLWERNLAFASVWRILSPAGTILSVAAGGPDEVFAITSDHHLWKHSDAGWLELSIGSFTALSAPQNPTGQDEVFATLTDSSFWEYSMGFSYPWQELLTSGAASSSSA